MKKDQPEEIEPEDWEEYDKATAALRKDYRVIFEFVEDAVGRGALRSEMAKDVVTCINAVYENWPFYLRGEAQSADEALVELQEMAEL